MTTESSEPTLQNEMASRSLVTVLVPVYNGQDHLRECLESIAAQTYSNWRALIVNNASSDGTRQIAEEYAQRDARFEVRNCEDFVSASENYNRALSFVPKDSEYVKFVEADNWLVPNCIELMVALANADSRIGFVGSYWLYGKRVLGSGISYRASSLTAADVGRLYFKEDEYILGTPTTLLFRRSILDGITPCFRPGIFYDDVELCLEVLTRGWTYGFIHQILSFVRNDNDGAFSRIADMDASVACKYFSFLKYGAYLTREEERVAVLDMLKRDYFDRLGRAAVLCRSTAYWDFHRSLFKINGMKLSRRQLVGAAGRRLLTEFARPLVFFARVVQHIKGRLFLTVRSAGR